MPYYLEKTALAPLSPDLLDRKRVERLFRMSVWGFGTSLWPSVNLSIDRARPTEHKGFYVPPAISFHWAGRDNPTYTLTLIGDDIDARIHEPSDKKSPWLSDETPDLAAIEAFWPPLRDPKQIEEMLEVFGHVEKIALDNYVLDLTDEEKLACVRREDINIDTLHNYARILGGGDAESEAYIEDHLLFAAYNPHGYLQQHDKLATMARRECREFSWRELLYGQDSYFTKKFYVIELDWKASAQDVQWCIETVAAARKWDKPALPREDDPDAPAGPYLSKALWELGAEGKFLLTVDVPGDSTVYTVLHGGKLASTFAAMGQELGLSSNLVVPEQRKGWLSRLWPFRKPRS
ncbi:MAG: hypothetical protein CR993_04600 [Rhodobacterales bacterium]|nr:MAG: hypothetical protein CR993_04600 [Rhodobacterales bacterium]